MGKTNWEMQNLTAVDWHIVETNDSNKIKFRLGFKWHFCLISITIQDLKSTI